MKRYFSTFIKTLNSHQNFESFLSHCKIIHHFDQVHAQFIKNGQISDPIVADKFLKYVSPCSISYAHKVFDQIPHRDVFLYNTMIKACSMTHDSFQTSLVLFRSIVRAHGLSPNRYTFVFCFKACGDGLCVLEGEQVLVHAIKVGLDSNVFVSNALIGMYSALGLVDEAKKVFDCAVWRDLYTWNIMIGGFAGSGSIDKAKELFVEMPEHDVVSWSTLIAGYVQVGRFAEALDIFHEMLQMGATPNEFTLTSALTACANLVALDQGRWIHVYIDKSNIVMNDRLLSSLIDMYAKCGEIDLAIKVFNGNDTMKKHVWPWNAMIGGYAMHGKPQDAIKTFEQMKVKNILPNKVTFVALLNACSHGYMVDEGRYYFKLMVDIHGLEPEMEHFGCMVDLLGRAGLLQEAEEMILSIPIPPDAAIWGSFLRACKLHKDIQRAERIGNIIKELEPSHTGCKVLLANLYSSYRRWNEVNIVREIIGKSGKKKTPGCSSIELNGVFYEFLSGDQSHPETEQLYMFLDEMNMKIKLAGYVPEVGEVLHDIDDEEERETALSKHSEKLAIAFGLMNTDSGTTIRIMKNLRVCLDCHEATKFISKVYEREIIVRDCIRFHHFKNGSCSCKDYW